MMMVSSSAGGKAVASVRRSSAMSSANSVQSNPLHARIPVENDIEMARTDEGRLVKETHHLAHDDESRVAAVPRLTSPSPGLATGNRSDRVHSMSTPRKGPIDR